jgi:hypothetical protein
VQRWRRPRGDAGAASLEATGMWGLGALLAASLALVLLAAAPGLGDAVRRAICVVVTLGQGDCGSATTTAAEHVPERPCVLGAKGHESMVEATFVFVSAGTGEHYLVEELSDGRYRITRGTQDSVGAAAGVGLTVQGVWDDKAYGVTAAAGVAGKVTFKEGEVYYVASEDAAEELLTKHRVDVAKDNTVGSSGPLRWVADGIESVFGGDSKLPDPDERYIEGGVTLSGDAKATWLASGGKAAVGVTQVLGARVGKDGSTTEYLSATVSGEVGAGTWAGADDGSYMYAELKAQGSVQTVIELERDKEGTVTAVRTRMITAGEAGATSTANGATSGPSTKGYTERVSELPIRNDADRDLAMRYLVGLGVQQVAGLSGPFAGAVSPLVAADAIAFAEAARARGFVTEQSFDADSSAYGAEVAGELIGKLGGAGQVTTVQRDSTGAKYFDGIAWQPWQACG